MDAIEVKARLVRWWNAARRTGGNSDLELEREIKPFGRIARSEPWDVMSFGAGASSDGIFNVYSVLQGIDTMISVDDLSSGISACHESPPFGRRFDFTAARLA
jgi:hypothetical protein